MEFFLTRVMLVVAAPDSVSNDRERRPKGVGNAEEQWGVWSNFNKFEFH